MVAHKFDKCVFKYKIINFMKIRYTLQQVLLPIWKVKYLFD